MRYKKYPSLFLYLVVVYFFLACPKDCNAQKQMDSLRYHYDLIIHPINIADVPTGIQYFLDKKNRALKAHDTLAVISHLRMAAIGQFKIGTMYDSENSSVEALELIRNFSFKDTLINARMGIYNQLGRIYRDLNNHKGAIEVFDAALTIANTKSDSITILNNKANVYKDMPDYQLAFVQYGTVYEMVIEQQDSLQLAMVLDNLGAVESKLDLPDGLAHLNRALQIRLRKNNPIGIYTSYKNLATHFLDNNDKKKALEYANKGYELVKQLNYGWYTQDALSLLLKINDDPKVQEFQRLTDSMATARQLTENKNAFIKYNLEEERKKVAASKLLQEQEKRTSLIYQGIAAFVLTLLIASFFVFRYRYKKGKLEQVMLTEHRISKKIHDEVANDIYHVMTMMQHKPERNELILDDLDKIYNKTRDISKEHSAVFVSENFGQVLSDLLLGYKSDAMVIVTKNLSKIDWNAVSEVKKTTIYRVLQELMTNMRKHSKASSVALTFQKTANKILIEYSDNGVGCDLIKRNGLQNAENRMASLKGSISFESRLNHGFRAKITI